MDGISEETCPVQGVDFYDACNRLGPLELPGACGRMSSAGGGSLQSPIRSVVGSCIIHTAPVVSILRGLTDRQ